MKKYNSFLTKKDEQIISINNIFYRVPDKISKKLLISQEHKEIFQKQENGRLIKFENFNNLINIGEGIYKLKQNEIYLKSTNQPIKQ